MSSVLVLIALNPGLRPVGRGRGVRRLDPLGPPLGGGGRGVAVGDGGAGEDAAEGLAVLAVEDGVDERVEGGVGVAQPRRHQEDGHGRLQRRQPRLQRQPREDVAREERDPAEQEAT